MWPIFVQAFLVLLADKVLARDLCPRIDACCAAVRGPAAFGDDEFHRQHCSSYLATTITPPALTLTVTTIGANVYESSTAAQNFGGGWKRRWNAMSNRIPDYASGCDDSAYRSICSEFGISGTTVTAPVPTITRTVSDSATNDIGRRSSVQTVTVTATVPADVSQPSGPSCLNDTRAQYFVDGFKDLLEYTSYNGSQGPPGRGYHMNVSNAILATNFQDWSDSINWMAGFPLGNVTFASKAAFDYGQGVLQPELHVTTLNVWHSCKTITWRWLAKTASNATVRGINQMVLNEDLSKIQTNYAEFDNAAWLASFGLQCKISRK